MKKSLITLLAAAAAFAAFSCGNGLRENRDNVFSITVESARKSEFVKLKDHVIFLKSPGANANTVLGIFN
jgi:hypothetical protein